MVITSRSAVSAVHSPSASNRNSRYMANTHGLKATIVIMILLFIPASHGFHMSTDPSMKDHHVILSLSARKPVNIASDKLATAKPFNK